MRATMRKPWCRQAPCRCEAVIILLAVCPIAARGRALLQTAPEAELSLASNFHPNKKWSGIMELPLAYYANVTSAATRKAVADPLRERILGARSPAPISSPGPSPRPGASAAEKYLLMDMGSNTGGGSPGCYDIYSYRYTRNPSYAATGDATTSSRGPDVQDFANGLCDTTDDFAIELARIMLKESDYASPDTSAAALALAENELCPGIWDEVVDWIFAALEYEPLSSFKIFGPTLVGAFNKAGISTCAVVSSYPILGQEIFHTGVSRGTPAAPYPGLISNSAASGKNMTDHWTALNFDGEAPRCYDYATRQSSTMPQYAPTGRPLASTSDSTIQSLARRYCRDPEAAGEEIALAMVGDISTPTPDNAAAALSLAGNTECPSTAEDIWDAVLLGARPLADYIKMAQTMMRAFIKVRLSTCYTLTVFDGYQGQVEGTFHTSNAA